MKKTIGLIESKGLVALVEAADVILKNSPVEILWIKKLNNGLVTLAVSGETDYVKGAMDSAVEAANKVGEIYSHSVIENPDDKLLDLFADTFDDFQTQISDIKSEKPEKEVLSKSFHQIVSVDSVVDNEVKDFKPSKKNSGKNILNRKDKSVSKKEIPFDHKAKRDSDTDRETDAENVPNISTIERLRKEALGLSDNGFKSKKNSGEKRADNNKVILSRNNVIDLSSIEQMNVHKLRHHAREFENFPIKGRQISRANRNELVELFKKIIS